ncbi:glycosyltransferase family 2 protein [Rubrimonas sp.]|uniref:glycosyltransferase family 2 protein n=1 Tax=Rubrimonas sp. TaxID=2036015 RepID=UPI002FDEFBB5
MPRDGPRPRWSVMIPVFNGADELRVSLPSVLAQAPPESEMQIEVVDDCSTRDDPAAVVAAVGGGRASFHRQPVNVGHSRNFNTCLKRARGDIVHLLHADDWVGPGFYAAMDRLFEAEPSLGAAFCRHQIIEPDRSVQWTSPLEQERAGVISGWLEQIVGELRIQAPSIVVRREVYERLGGFDARILSCGEDWEMWTRITAAGYPVGYVPEILAFYRDSPESLTKRSIRSGQNIRDLRNAVGIIGGYLPPELVSDARRRGLENWSRFALRYANAAAARGDAEATLVQLREALLCGRSPRTLRAVAVVAAKLFRARLDSHAPRWRKSREIAGRWLRRAFMRPIRRTIRQLRRPKP